MSERQPVRDIHLNACQHTVSAETAANLNVRGRLMLFVKRDVEYAEYYELAVKGLNNKLLQKQYWTSRPTKNGKFLGQELSASPERPTITNSNPSPSAIQHTGWELRHATSCVMHSWPSNTTNQIGLNNLAGKVQGKDECRLTEWPPKWCPRPRLSHTR